VRRGLSYLALADLNNLYCCYSWLKSRW